MWHENNGNTMCQHNENFENYFLKKKIILSATRHNGIACYLVYTGL